MALVKFPGNCPRSAPKDAKYTVRLRDQNPVVAVVYRLGGRERAILCTEDHPELVRMVMKVKEEAEGQTTGVFYINEYQQVIVPAGKPVEYYYAGEYHQILRFDFSGSTISPEPLDENNHRLKILDTWVGPHPGIPYKLCAGADDIGYRIQVKPNVVREIRLSDFVDRSKARVMARKIHAVKGYAGGRFYVNECRAIFAPQTKQDVLRFVYIGQLEEGDPWFPKPEVQEPR